MSLATHPARAFLPYPDAAVPNAPLARCRA
jgi:hypothetical protein